MLFGLLWLFVFLRVNKSERIFMLVIGAIFGVVGIVYERILFKDWWQPVYVFGYDILPIEDILYGFFVVGSITGLVPMILRERVVGKVRPNWPVIIKISVAGVALMAFLLYVCQVSSVVASLTTLLVAGIGSLLYLKKHDALWRHILVGLIVMLVSLAIYPILWLINPELLGQWKMDQLSGIVIWWQPIEDVLFHFAAGFGLSSLYEVAFRFREVRTPTKGKSIKKRTSTKKRR
ncbi:hypothetical protein FACS189431_4940 [Alphaproteobacteria bacterium]|nr:hypothetical protein FACS189431_4940 [Alphaproteobacteria bacterium]